ncbi:hypothetical protein ACN4EE_01570 [Geminocystis sp. CENA526]|uniref:hypothetical protein n=1 Tax=Geminocystis sp. CENA526 TaxID=1355871 RepID=UPI003D6FA999
MSDLFLNLGIDFGTSFTKVCVRDIDRENSWIVNFAEDKKQVNDALLPTKILIKNDGNLLTGLTLSEWKTVNTNEGILVDFVKMRLANIDLSQEEKTYSFDQLPHYKKNDLNTPEQIENLCTFYLSCIIIKAKNWVLKNNSDLVKNLDINWSVNVGVPVKYFDSLAINRFKKVIRLALLLTENHPNNFQELCQRMKENRQKLTELSMNKADNEIPIAGFAVPEIKGAIYSYTISRQAKDGIYIFFDIGSGTTEGVSFRFYREDDIPKIEFYSGEVEAIGINALAKKIINNTDLEESKIVSYLQRKDVLFLQYIDKYSRKISRSPNTGEIVVYKKSNVTITAENIKSKLKQISNDKEKLCLYSILTMYFIRKMVAKVIVSCKKKNPEYFEAKVEHNQNLTVFIGGGGQPSYYYQDTIKSTHIAFNQERFDIPPYKLKNVPYPGGGLTETEDFSMSGISPKYFHRFAIAYGLSIPDGEGAEIEGFPSLYKEKKRVESQPYMPEIGRYSDDHSSM